MTMHTRAFGDMNFLIYGEDSTIPMKLEQTFAAARPSDEISFDSFEDYDQAYDFTKDNKNVGLIFMLENCGSKDLNSTFTQLSKLADHQEACFGILIHDGQESFKGLRAMKDNDNFLAYYDVNDLLDKDKAPFLLLEIWQKYQDAFEKQILPNALAQTYRSIALLHTNEEELNFSSRLCNLLTSEMNVSWKEGFLLKWHPVLEVLERDESHTLSANKSLSSLYESIKSSISSENISDIANSDIGVAQKIIAATSLLSKKNKNNQLEQHLSETLASVTPRSKALLRIVKRNEERIIEFAKNTSRTTRILKVV